MPRSLGLHRDPRQADDRCRTPGPPSAARAAGSPVTRTHRPADHRGRARAWHDAVTELTELQAQYAAWLEALPNGLQDGATAGALRAVCDFDLTDLQAIDPPRGFGRD